MNWHDLEVRVCLVRVEIEWIENNEKNGFVCCLVKKKGKKTFWVEPRYFFNRTYTKTCLFTLERKQA